ncbi:response regulator [Halioxenophilus sp. WMMB6]|uniref:response regulator n=1 Tax=Halioxenophilus sp. WMMB6 TaxID=3073815 RepID=UPI00295EF059|nr:response regulator [Halioxenophilus sp. WMMB6]
MTAPSATILIVEDEPHLASLLAEYLAASHFTVAVVHRGDEVLPWLEQHSADAILLDLMLPGIDGIEVCKRVRQRSSVPILMTTARIEEIDRLLGLELGADDYICKPYSPREVVARVKAVLRRSQLASEEPSSQGIELLVDRCQVVINGQTLTLTGTETQLLALLMKEPGRIFSRNHIMDSIYRDYRIVSERTIDSHVKKLRKKIAMLEQDHDYVQSVYGVGYKFEPK